MDVQATAQRQLLAASGDNTPAPAAASPGFAQALGTARANGEAAPTAAPAARWLTTPEAAQASKPHPSDFAKACGLPHLDACELLYGVVGSNVERRNWQAIMAAPDPVLAARQATREMYGDTTQPRREDAAYLDEQRTVAREGHFAACEVGTVKRPEVSLMMVDAQGLLLRHAGGNEAAIARNAWLFGFDVGDLKTLAPKVQAAAPALAMTMQAAAADPHAMRLMSLPPLADAEPMKSALQTRTGEADAAPAQAAPELTPATAAAAVAAGTELAASAAAQGVANGADGADDVDGAGEAALGAVAAVQEPAGSERLADQWAADAARQVAWVSSSQVLEALFDAQKGA